MSDKTAQEWPDLQRSWAGREIEMPNETMATNRVRPSNFIERALMPNAQAVTYPWGTIALNRKSIEDTQSDLGDVLAHELTHIGQNRKSGMLGGIWDNFRQRGSNYGAKDYEQEALEAESQRKVRRFDIPLLNKKNIDPNIQVPTVKIR